MPSSNYDQTVFLGGEWSPSAQGRFDDPRYRTALNVCYNSLPIEAGAWARRSGTQNLGPTYKGQPACLRPFRLSDGRVMLVEISYHDDESQAYLRFWLLPYTGPQFDTVTGAPKNYALIPDETADIVGVSSDNPAVLEVDPGQTWQTGDVAVLYFAPCQCGQLNFRQVILTRISDTLFSLADSYTGDPIDGAQVDGFTGAGNNIAAHVLTLEAPYTAVTNFDLIRIAQSGIDAYFVGGDDVPPWVLSVAHIPTDAAPDPDITFEEVDFIDGPYLAPLAGNSQTGNATGTVSAAGTTTPTFASGSYSFVAGDIGVKIRLWSQPAAYNPASAYNAADLVTYQGAWWRANTAVPAGVYPNGVSATSAGVLYWLLTPQAGQWVYGEITNAAAGVATLSLNAGIPAANGTTVDAWQLGVSRSTNYPSAVQFYQGRVWFAAAAQGRIDASMTGGAVGNTITMSPTDPFGNLNDDSGIGAVFDIGAPFYVLWMSPDRSGLLVGTTDGEYALQASALSDPLTPTSIQISKVSAYGSAAIEPLRIGLADIFVQRARKKVFEYLLDYFSQKFVGRHLNEYAKHLTASDIQEIVYTEEKVPAIWCRTGDGNFIGCTYRRDSSLMSAPPLFYGWHQHELGSARFVTSICGATPATRNAELVDGVAMVTRDSNSRHTVEVLRPQFDDADTVEHGWFLDTAIVPGGTDQPTVTPGPTPPGITPGSYYFEVTIVARSRSTGNTQMPGGSIRIGLATLGADLTDLDGDSDSLFFYDQANWWANGSFTTLNRPWANGDVLGFAIDTVNQLIWYKNITAGTPWNLGGNPETGAGGFSFAPVGDNAWFFASAIHYGSADTVAINTGGSAFTGTPPTGFPALAASGNFAFNFADLTPGAVLSNGNKTLATGGSLSYYQGLNGPGVPFTWTSTYTYLTGDFCQAGGAAFQAVNWFGIPNINRSPLSLGIGSNWWCFVPPSGLGKAYIYQGARANTALPRV